jgi:hypothetical protein
MKMCLNVTDDFMEKPVHIMFYLQNILIIQLKIFQHEVLLLVHQTHIRCDILTTLEKVYLGVRRSQK